MSTNLQIDTKVNENAQPVKDQDGGTTSLTLSTDKVGIGTTNPSAMLEIVGNWTGEEGALRLTGDKPTMKFSGQEISGNQTWILHVGSNGPGNFEFFRKIGPSQWSNVMALAPTGNVGIGSTHPNGKLEVVGDWTGAHGALTISGDKPSIRFSGGAVAGSQTWLLHQGSDGGGNLQFFNGGTTGTWAHVMSLTPNGNIGIGTTAPTEKLEVNGSIKVSGDILLANADCAEDFTIGTELAIEPGTVMVVGAEGALFPCLQAYDKRVAGVVSGAGDYKPGIVLDKQQSTNNRQPIALLGKVYCKVDAQYGAIEIGDSLTTSPTLGHAMKVEEPLAALGAMLGKALSPLQEGQGLIPILIALQ